MSVIDPPSSHGSTQKRQEVSSSIVQIVDAQKNWSTSGSGGLEVSPWSRRVSSLEPKPSDAERDPGAVEITDSQAA